MPKAGGLQGDGLPTLSVTDDLLDSFVRAGQTAGDAVVGEVPFLNARCTAADIAYWAVAAGAPASAMPLLCSAVSAMTDPGFRLDGICATTESAAIAMVINGSQRDQLDIRYGFGCLGGGGGAGPAVGRAVQLIVKNVFGQVPGDSSWSVFGQPARVTGLVFGEWEERSPWPPLSERRGTPGDALTIFAAQGTLDIVDVTARDSETLLAVIGKAMANPATPTTIGPGHGEMLVALCPTWAEIVARAVPDMAEVNRLIWEHAALPLSWFPPPHQRVLEELDKVDRQGQVHVVPRPDDVLVAVCGGTGGLHATGVHGWPSRSITRPVPSQE
ncbi:MAG: hypothetical protein JO337_11445 [Acidimicrobiales bacterium]|nr:hypothetical protein [Acidimicrobiales bacterium]